MSDNPYSNGTRWDLQEPTETTPPPDTPIYDALLKALYAN